MRSPHFYYAYLALYKVWCLVYYNRCKEEVNNMKWFKEHNQNPWGLNISDCVYRAISLVLEKPYREVVKELKAYAGSDRNPNNGNCFLPWLQTQGYEIREFSTKITVNQFLNELHECDEPDRFDALLLVNGHLTAVKCGVCCDTWNCGRYKCQLLIIKE